MNRLQPAEATRSKGIAVQRIVAVLALLAMTSLSRAAWAAGAAPPQITGSVTYRQRIALPPNAILRVQVQDVSRQDAAATTLAEATMRTGGKQVPLSFAVAYEESAVDPKHTYSVRATISSGDELLWTSTTSNPVITNGAPTHVDIGLSQVPAAQSSVPLEGSAWKLSELDGAPPAAASQERQAELQFNADGHRIAATGGCNRLLGSYELRGEALPIAPGGMTMMACPEPLMAQERSFTDALRATKSYQIDGETLQLMDGDRILARFRASAQK